MKAFSPQSTPEQRQAAPASIRPRARGRGPSVAAISRQPALGDQRPEALAQQKLQAMMQQSPQGQRLARLQAMLASSPRQVAQRQHMERLFGPAVPWQAEVEAADKAIQKATRPPVQRQGAPAEEDAVLQGQGALRATSTQPLRHDNRTGLPDTLKAGIEHLSGPSMDDENLHYHSAKPTQLQALAYTQGPAIHTKSRRGMNEGFRSGLLSARVRYNLGERSADHCRENSHDRGVHVLQQAQGHATTNLQPGARHAHHVVQMLPLKTLPPNPPKWEALLEYFAKILQPELQEAEQDDKEQVSQYAPWWKHEVLVSARWLQYHLLDSKNEEKAVKEVHKLVELLLYPAPVLGLIPEALNLPTTEEHGSLSVRPWTEKEYQLLAGKKEALLSDDVGKRKEAIEQIRGKDKQYHIGQGAILRRFIMEERKAIMGLVSAAIGSDAIFSLERGGSMISDLIVRLAGVVQSIKFANIKEPKVWMSNPNSNSNAQVEDKKKQRENFKASIRKFVGERAQEGNKVVISIAETAVGGSSVNELLADVQQLDTEFQKSKFNVKFRILVARETIKNVNYEGEGRLKLRDPAKKLKGETVSWDGGKKSKNTTGIAYPEKLEFQESKQSVQTQDELPLSRVEMYISQLRYLIGEDVNYQLSYENPNMPVIVFDEADNTLHGVSIQPGNNDSAREIILDLIAGAYDSLLNDVFGAEL